MTKNDMSPFFDILKTGKYQTQNTLYCSGKKIGKKQYDFQSNIQQNKD